MVEDTNIEATIEAGSEEARVELPKTERQLAKEETDAERFTLGLNDPALGHKNDASDVLLTQTDGLTIWETIKEALAYLLPAFVRTIDPSRPDTHLLVSHRNAKYSPDHQSDASPDIDIEKAPVTGNTLPETIEVKKGLDGASEDLKRQSEAAFTPGQTVDLDHNPALTPGVNNG